MPPLKENLVYFAVILGCYLLGAIPFGFVLAKFMKGVDLRKVGSGNIGATNAARVLGGFWFFPIFALDFLKGFAPVFWLAPWVASHLPCPTCPALAAMLAVTCGGAAIAGHLWPVYLGFKGGKGVATGIAVIMAMNWIAGTTGFAIWIVCFIAFRYVSLGSVIGAMPLAFVQHFTARRIGRPWETPWPITIFCGIISLVVIFKHRENLQRLLRGEEKKFYFTKGSGG